MQRISNYGSTLQAYALWQLLQSKAPSANIRYIDYEPGAPLIEAPENDEYHGPRRVVAKLIRYNSTSTTLSNRVRFFNHKRRYSSQYLPSIGVQGARDTSTKVDLQIIGSDEVFNCVQANARVGYTPDLFGSGSRAKHLATYAASFGNTTLQKIEDFGLQSELSTYLKRFDDLSVRDANSKEIVENLTGRTPAVHLDPTLVYDFSADQNVAAPIPARRPYMIVYGYSGSFTPEENRAVAGFAKRAGLQVLAFGGLQESADYFIDCHPFEILEYFRRAEFVVTDTFHGSIFSIINEIPFATIVRPNDGHRRSNSEKLGYLLESLGMVDRELKNPSLLSSVLEDDPDFARARAFRDVGRISACNYISGLLDRI